MSELLFIILLTLFVEIVCSPRLDYTRNKEMLLWYGFKKRYWIKLW